MLSSALLFGSRQIIPLKVTKGILFGQDAGMAALGGLLEIFYRPILKYAEEKNIPVLDLTNSFNPYDSELYIKQIEPSQKGGETIAQGINHIVKNHNFKGSCKTYSLENNEWQSFDPHHWQVRYPQKV